MKIKKVIRVRHFKCGYEVRREIVDGKDFGGEDTEWSAAYTPNGDYIGSPRDANRLVAQRGIAPQTRTTGSGTCSIGYSTKDGKWYGWSHRAIFGFRVGSTCKKGDCHYRAKNQRGRGNWSAETTQDAKQMAMDFAESVS